MQRKVIFFDLGNTLTHRYEVSARRALGHRLDLSDDEVKRVGRLIMTCPALDPQTLTVELEPLLIGVAPQRILEAVQAVWQQQMEEFSLLPEVMEVLDRLKAMSYRLGLLSNLWHPVFEAFRIKASEALECFELLTLSYRIGAKKPSSSIFEQAVFAAGVPSHLCWMVGDSYELDLDPAMKMGMRTVWVLSRPEAEKPLLAEVLRQEKPRPTSAIDCLRDLPRIIDALS